MQMWDELFSKEDLIVAQTLLTRADLADRQGYLNARNTLLALLERQVVPIINENDVVATEEIKIGDNDNLSALVANLIDADLLILLTDQDGLYTADPAPPLDGDADSRGACHLRRDHRAGGGRGHLTRHGRDGDEAAGRPPRDRIRGDRTGRRRYDRQCPCKVRHRGAGGHAVSRRIARAWKAASGGFSQGSPARPRRTSMRER